eukprot:COSAG05_NODE_2274_length_3299_cov_1.773750_1_plen_41_part_10
MRAQLKTKDATIAERDAELAELKAQLAAALAGNGGGGRDGG